MRKYMAIALVVLLLITLFGCTKRDNSIPEEVPLTTSQEKESVNDPEQTVNEEPNTVANTESRPESRPESNSESGAESNPESNTENDNRPTEKETEATDSPDDSAQENTTAPLEQIGGNSVWGSPGAED